MTGNSVPKKIIYVIFCFTSIQNIHAQTLQKTKSGLSYKIFPGKGGEKPVAGEFAKCYIRYTINPQDSIMHSSFNNIPDYTPVDTSEKSQFSFMEVVRKMNVGDSAEINISIDTLVNDKMIPAYNSTFQKGNNITCNVKLLAVFKSDSLVKEDYANEIELEKNREVKDIENYLTKNNIKAQKTENGVYVSIESAGDTAKAIDGKTASVKYKGYLFNGNVFDTNMDSSKGHTDPIDVTVGQQQVIKGWEEALPYFGKGGKGKIYIPAMLAYGPRAMGADIPAFSNLIFDMEVVDVK